MRVERAWQVAPPAPAAALRRLGVLSPLVAQLLWNRGIRDAPAARRFLAPERQPLGDAARMAGVPAAVRRIRQAIAAGERIAVHGDYDADGVTATAVMVEALRHLGADPLVFIPHRERDGYGLSPASVETVVGQGARLLLTVDCGVTANAEIALAAERGLDVVVTDHHHVPVELPAAHAVVNPRQPGCGYGYADLSGVGVAFALARALLEDALPSAAAERASEALLDLVAVGTVADVVPLVGENRTLVARGLRVLQRAERPGVRALLAAAGLEPAHLTAQQVAYAVAPRLNAAGRMGEAMDAYALLVARDAATADALAAQLNTLNRERQAAVEAGVARARAAADLTAPAVVVCGDYAPGIAGLVAGRLAELTGRPAVVLEAGPELCRGSARGPEGFHLAAALQQCADLLVKYGGHAQAAGLTLRTALLPAFVERFVALAREALPGLGPAGARWIDGAIPLTAINWAFAEDLRALEPYGTANPVPTFCTERAFVRDVRPLGERGVALRLSDYGLPLRAALFGWDGEIPPVGTPVAIVYEVERRVWRGHVQLELRLRDLRPCAR